MATKQTSKPKMKSRSESETNVYLLMRGLDERSSLLFAVIVSVEEPEPGLFEGAIGGMENRIVASGTSPEIAVEHTLLAFMATADDALESGASVEHATGVPSTHVKFPVSMAD